MLIVEGTQVLVEFSATSAPNFLLISSQSA